MKRIPPGIVYALASSAIFSIMNVLVKATASSIPTNEIVFFRSSIGMIIILGIIRHRGVTFSSDHKKILVLRGILGGAYMIAYFMALSQLPLLDTMILVNLSPIFVLIFSGICLREHLSKKVLVAVPYIVAGVMLTLSPWSFNSFGLSLLWGIGAAVFSGGAATSIRYLGKTGHNPLEIIFYFMMMSTIISGVLMWQDFVMPSGLEWMALILIGVVSLLAQVYLTKAFSHEKALLVELVRYIGIVINGLWGLVLWKEIPSLTTLIGGILIVGGCIKISQIRAKEAL